LVVCSTYVAGSPTVEAPCVLSGSYTSCTRQRSTLATRIASSGPPRRSSSRTPRGAGSNSPRSSAGSTPWSWRSPTDGHDRRLALRRRELPRRRRALLGVHAIRPGAPSAGVRGLLARAVPPRQGPRPGRARHGEVLRAHGAVRVGGSGPALHAARRGGRADRVRRRDEARGRGRAAARGPDAELPLRD